MPTDFEQLPISNALKKSLANEGYTKMKPIQSQAIPHLLAGRNVLGAAPTGSGKTLAFLIPAIELLTYSRARPAHGTIAIILSPSRELALQTYAVASKLMKNISPTVAAIVGGQKGFQDEAYQFRKSGVNLLIATTGRLRKHLEEGYIKLDKFQYLVIDEADRMLEAGFADDLFAIFSHIKNPKQTALFSATLTRDVEGLMSINISSPPVFCGPSNTANVSTLSHCYAITPMADRVAILISILRKLVHKKVIVFVSARKEAEFLSMVFNSIDIPNDAFHGNLSQEERSLAFTKFNRPEGHILIATNVAARGLDFPAVDWSISVGPPDTVKEYIHRAGRTGRNEMFGQSMLLLAPNEKCFVDKVRAMSITIKKIELQLDGIEKEKENIMNAINSSRTFYDTAIDAAIAFEKSYEARPADTGIRIIDIEMNDVRKSYCLEPEGH